eukprot:644323_1
MYMTNEYASNKDAFGVHRNYDDLLTANQYHCNEFECIDVKNWFLNNFNDWDKSVQLKYFGLFVDGGCKSLDDILLVENEDVKTNWSEASISQVENYERD